MKRNKTSKGMKKAKTRMGVAEDADRETTGRNFKSIE